MGLLFGQCPFNTFYQSKNGQDNRFLITSPATGCMLYYDATLGKFVNSNSLLFDPTTFTFSVHQVSTDAVVSGTILSDTIELVDSYPPPYNQNMIMECENGQILFYAPNPTIPATAGSISIVWNGTILLSGPANAIKYYDRSGAFVVIDTFVDSSTYQIKENTNSIIIWEISNVGNSAIRGTSAGMRFYQQSLTPTNYYSLFTNSSSVFNITYNGSSIATIGSTGITTLVPQKIQNTLQTTATQFLTMMPLSATTTAGQSVGTHATLTYDVANARLTTTNINATLFTGALTGSASFIKNTLQTTGTQFLTMVPLSSSTASQVVGTHADLTYDVGSATLTTSNVTATLFTGAGTGLTGTGSSFTAGSADLVKVQTAISVMINYPVIFGTASTTATLLNEINLFYNPSTNNLALTSGTFNCPTITAGTQFTGAGTGLTGTGSSFTAGTANTIKNVLQTTGTQFLTMLPLSSSTASQVVGTHANMFYVVGEGQLNIGDGVGYVSVDAVPLAMLDNTLAYDGFNNIQLGALNATNKSWFIGARDTAVAVDTMLSIAPYGTSQTAHFYINASGTTSSPVIEARTQFTGPGTGLTGTGASFRSGVTDAIRLTTTAVSSAYGIVFGTANASATLFNDAQLTYNPTTNAMVLTSGSFTGTSSTISGTTLTASTQFTGPGTGLSGTGASFTAGTANAIKTIVQPAGTYRPVWLNSISASASQAVFVDTTDMISFDTTINVVNIGTLTNTTATIIYLNNLVNVVFTAPLGNQTFLSCFSSLYKNYDINIYISDTLCSNSYLFIDLATSGGVRLGASWRTATSYVSGTAMVSVTTPTASAYISLIPSISGTHYQFKLFSPATTRRKGIQCINAGYLTASTETAFTTTGGNTSTTSYPSLFVSAGSGSVALNGNISIVGYN